jgi:FAD/FMN-containing dehydrogenase
MKHPREAGLRRRSYASWSKVLPGASLCAPDGQGWLEGCARGLSLAPRGAGRSFGDAAFGVPEGLTCQAPRGGAFDLDTGTHRLWMDAGDSVGSAHRRLEGTAFEFPIYGGTQWASVGGAAAGDIHGKNHLDEGSFGRHVEALDIVLASGETLRCSRSLHDDLFHATLGGMGLTGLITRVALKVRPRASPTLRVRRRQVADLDALWPLLWPDTPPDYAFATFFDLAQARPRGLVFQADRTAEATPPPRIARRIDLPRLPVITPGAVRTVGRIVLNATREPAETLVHRRDFNYSGLHEHLYGWNQLYGLRGMIEYQFAASRAAFPALVERFVALARDHDAPMLAAVIKPMGPLASGGLLSFPMAGATINFQTPWSPRALAWLDQGSEAVIAAGGRVNLTKDCCLRPGQMARMYPDLDRWREAVRTYDPQGRVLSALARRLDLKPWASAPAS